MEIEKIKERKVTHKIRPIEVALPPAQQLAEPGGPTKGKALKHDTSIEIFSQVATLLDAGAGAPAASAGASAVLDAMAPSQDGAGSSRSSRVASARHRAAFGASGIGESDQSGDGVSTDSGTSSAV